MLIFFFDFFLKVLSNLISIIYPISFSRRLTVLFNRFYTIRIKKVFRSFGEKNYINYPLYISGGNFINVGNNCSFGRRLRLEAIGKYVNNHYTPTISIGSNVDIGSDCHFGAINKILICDNVLIASKVFISDHSHGTNNLIDLLIPPRMRDLYSKGSVIIENNVWIGESVTILSNVVIGANSIIGANSVVTKNIPPNCIVAGIPAKIIKKIK